MDDFNCCDEIKSNPLKRGMTAIFPWKHKHPKQKDGSNYSES